MGTPSFLIAMRRCRRLGWFMLALACWMPFQSWAVMAWSPGGGTPVSPVVAGPDGVQRDAPQHDATVPPCHRMPEAALATPPAHAGDAAPLPASHRPDTLKAKPACATCCQGVPAVAMSSLPIAAPLLMEARPLLPVHVPADHIPDPLSEPPRSSRC